MVSMMLWTDRMACETCFTNKVVLLETQPKF